MKLTPRTIKNDEDFENTKLFFIKEINKQRKFKGLNLTYANKQLSDEACWEKFVIGGKEYHGNTNKIDYVRANRVHWIFTILDYLENKNYENLSRKISVKGNEGDHEIVVFEQKYYLYLRKNKYNPNEYVLVTAFVKK